MTYAQVLDHLTMLVDSARDAETAERRRQLLAKAREALGDARALADDLVASVRPAMIPYAKSSRQALTEIESAIAEIEGGTAP